MSKNDAKRSSDARFVHYVYKLLRLLQLIVKVATTTAPLIHLLRLTLELCHKLMQHISFILDAFFVFSFFFYGPHRSCQWNWKGGARSSRR